MGLLVGGLVELDAERTETVDDALADLGGILADTAGHDDRVSAADDGVVTADVERRAIGQHLKREFGLLVTLRRLAADVAAVGGTGEREETGALVEQRIGLRGRELFGLHDGKDGRRIDVTAARTHHHARKRGQSHGGVDALAVLDGRERGTVAHMAGHEIDLGHGLLEELRGLLHDELVRSAVEAVLADTHLLIVLGIDRVHRRAIGHRLMEGRIEHRNVGHPLEDLLASLDAAEIRGHVQGAELDELLELLHHGRRDLHGVLEDLRAMKDTVADRVNVLRGIAEIGDDLIQRSRVVLGTAAADALDEALRDALALLHVEELVLERARARVDDENFPDCLLHFHFSS